jgi:hypothetical protein
MENLVQFFKEVYSSNDDDDDDDVDDNDDSGSGIYIIYLTIFSVAQNT